MDALFAKIQQQLSPHPDQKNIFLVIGLGNPGRDYKDTRHNIGFMVIDALSNKWHFSSPKVQAKAIILSGIIPAGKIILAKPQTYMNLSGQAVSSLISFYKIPITNLIVINDDIDLPFGTIRLRPGGGSAGQKGVGSIIDKLGTQEFARLRMGIGRPPGQMQSADYVLQTFSKDEMEMMTSFLRTAADAIEEFINNGLDSAMNKFNGAH